MFGAQVDELPGETNKATQVAHTGNNCHEDVRPFPAYRVLSVLDNRRYKAGFDRVCKGTGLVITLCQNISQM